MGITRKLINCRVIKISEWRRCLKEKTEVAVDVMLKDLLATVEAKCTINGKQILKKTEPADISEQNAKSMGSSS